MSSVPAVRRSLTGARATWRDAYARSSMLAARASRASRLRAIAAGLLPQEIAVLHSGGGRHASGLFSEFASVLGFLDHYERWRRCYAGVLVDYRDGLYAEPAAGSNWWNSYFTPIAMRHADGPLRAVGQSYHDLCANHVERTMVRGRAADLVDRYIGAAPHVHAMVDEFVARHWQGAAVIGVHYRGTDKVIDARRVPYDEVAAKIDDRLSAAGRHGKVFVATDEDAFVEFVRGRFPGRVVARDMFRSSDGRPIDIVNDDGNYRKGLDAVVDCLLLSRTDFLIRTASNLGLCATFFNRLLPAVLLNPER